MKRSTESSQNSVSTTSADSTVDVCTNMNATHGNGIDCDTTARHKEMLKRSDNENSFEDKVCQGIVHGRDDMFGTKNSEATSWRWNSVSASILIFCVYNFAFLIYWVSNNFKN